MTTATETPFAVELGQSVRLRDEHGVEHDGLVTAIHGHRSEAAAREAGLTSEFRIPSINAVYVSGDAAKSDPYGRQLERLSSLQHRSTATAHGRFYDLP